MRKLDLKEIQELASRPGIKKKAVENFLLTVHINTSEPAAYLNMIRDAEMYNWNMETQEAIYEGILLSSGKKEV